MYRKRRKRAPYFENVSSVVDGLVKDLRLEKGLKISSFSKIWGKIIGPRFEKTSKVFSINEINGVDVVNIAVSSSSVAQDLIFYKSDILKKLNPIGKNFGFNIKDVNFSTKNWKVEIPNKNHVEEKVLTEEELDKIFIPDDIISSIRASLNEEGFLDEEIKERFFNTIVKDLKRQVWERQNKLN